MAQNNQESIYHYMVNAGATDGYDVLYDFNYNYLMDTNGKPVLHFARWGGSPQSNWGGGGQATLLSEYHPLPAGIHVRWFSVAENKFYEGEYVFDSNMLNRLMPYKVDDLFLREELAYNHFFSFNVNLALGGLATVWVGGQGERYLLAQFYVPEVQEDNWERFIQKHRHTSMPTREAFIESAFADSDSLMSTKTKQEIAEGRLPVDGAPWKRLMQKFPWILVGDENFTVTDYFAWYKNGEQYFTYEQADKGFLQDRSLQPVPSQLFFYIRENSPEKKLYRIRLYLNEEEVMQKFEEMNRLEPANAPFKMQLVISPNLDNIDAYLFKGKNGIELEIKHAALKDLYDNQ